MVARLLIAEGTEHEIGVWDVRGEHPWSISTGWRGSRPPSRLVIHHTDEATAATTMAEQQALLRAGAENWRYGVPYNFVMFPGAKRHIYYLNDVEWCWPHTLNGNCHVAIAVWGNFERLAVPGRLAYRVERLARALMSMWGRDIPTKGHRDFTPTACPGANLYATLKARGLIT